MDRRRRRSSKESSFRPPAPSPSLSPFLVFPPFQSLVTYSPLSVEAQRSFVRPAAVRSWRWQRCTLKCIFYSKRLRETRPGGQRIHATFCREICFTEEEEEDWRRLPAKDAGVDDDAMEKKKKATQFPDFELSFLELFQDTETAPILKLLQETRLSGDGMGDSN